MIKNIYIFNTMNSGHTLFFRASHRLLKSPERIKIFQHSEKFHDNAILQSEKVVQKSK